jgi:hypothetical protein
LQQGERGHSAFSDLLQKADLTSLSSHSKPPHAPPHHLLQPQRHPFCPLQRPGRMDTATRLRHHLHTGNQGAARTDQPRALRSAGLPRLLAFSREKRLQRGADPLQTEARQGRRRLRRTALRQRRSHPAHRLRRPHLAQLLLPLRHDRRCAAGGQNGISRLLLRLGARTAQGKAQPASSSATTTSPTTRSISTTLQATRTLPASCPKSGPG